MSQYDTDFPGHDQDLFLLFLCFWIVPAVLTRLPGVRSWVLSRQGTLDRHTRDLVADSMQAALEEGDDQYLAVGLEFALREGRNLASCPDDSPDDDDCPPTRIGDMSALRKTASDWLRWQSKQRHHVLLHAGSVGAQILLRVVVGPCLLAAWGSRGPGGWQAGGAPLPSPADRVVLAACESFLSFEAVVATVFLCGWSPVGVWWTRGLRSKVYWPRLSGADTPPTPGGRTPATPLRCTPAKQRALERLARGHLVPSLVLFHRVFLLLLLRLSLWSGVPAEVLRIAASIEVFLPMIDLRPIVVMFAGRWSPLSRFRVVMAGLGVLSVTRCTASVVLLVSVIHHVDAAEHPWPMAVIGTYFCQMILVLFVWHGVFIHDLVVERQAVQRRGQEAAQEYPEARPLVYPISVGGQG
jgi:hypothetical protein